MPEPRNDKHRADPQKKQRRPSAPARPVDLVQVSEWKDGSLSRLDDYLVAEEPLEIRIGAKPVSVTMRTPGHDLELAAGFLFTEGVISGPDDIARLSQPAARGRKANAVRVDVRAGKNIDQARLQRHFAANASCGLCGKASIDAVRVRGIVRPNPAFRLDADVLCRLPEALRSNQPLFGRTGGPHAAGLFDASGKLLVSREDVGRHNAVDKVVGWAVLQDLVPLNESVLLVSGRGSFEIVQKALAAGIPVVACVSAPSSLAVQLAWKFTLTLVGFLRGKRFVIYAGEKRMSL